MIDYKLEPPDHTRETQKKDPFSSPELPLMPKALLLLFTPKYSEIIIFIALALILL